MANPARELADLLEMWQVPQNRSPMQARTASAKERGTDWSRDHTNACRLLVDIDRWIKRIEQRGIPVDGYWETLPRWQRAVFSTDHAWGQQFAGGAVAIERDPLHILRSLAVSIDLAGGALDITPATAAAALKIIERTEVLVREAAEISDSLRHHILGMLAELREVIESGAGDRIGPLVAEVIGTATLVAERAPEPQRAKWRTVASDWVVQFTAAYAATEAVPLLEKAAHAASNAIGS